MPETENFTECIDLFVLLVLEGDFGSLTPAFSSLHRTESSSPVDLTPCTVKDEMTFSLSKATCWMYKHAMYLNHWYLTQFKNLTSKWNVRHVLCTARILFLKILKIWNLRCFWRANSSGKYTQIFTSTIRICVPESGNLYIYACLGRGVGKTYLVPAVYHDLVVDFSTSLKVGLCSSIVCLSLCKSRLSKCIKQLYQKDSNSKMNFLNENENDCNWYLWWLNREIF